MAQADEPSRDMWVGASATRDMWMIYSGGTLAPFTSIHGQGWRLRAGAGYGGYEYDSARSGGVARFSGIVTFADALIGYQSQFGHLTAKAFLGASFIEHRLNPSDDLAMAGGDWGPKVQTELWYDAGRGYWLSLSANYTTAHDTYAVRTRAGWRLSDTLSIGPELSVDDNAVDTVDVEAAYARGGLFATYAWRTGEISISSGAAGEMDGDLSPYATVNLYTRF